jgi:hypothetical protein
MAISSSIFITAQDARQNAMREYVVHNEARAIENAVLVSAKDGYYETTVSGDTAMTDGATANVLVSVVNSPDGSFTIPSHPYQTGSVVTVFANGTLPTPLATNTYYYVIYIDANTVKLASSLANVLKPIPQPIALTDTGTGEMYMTLYPPSRDYFNTWKALPTSNSLNDRPYQDQMDTVIAYFTNLGYNIARQTNPSTNNTLQWYIKW